MCRRLLNFKTVQIMKTKKFDEFDKNGNLPPGIHNMTLDELEEHFSKDKSEKRKEIMAHYKKCLTDIRNTQYYIGHWIDGSFVTVKENPNNINTLTEFNGYEADKNKDGEKIEELILSSQIKSNHLFKSLRIYRYPATKKESYEFYLKYKIRILTKLFGYDRKNNQKGIVHLIGDNHYEI